jgi:hypothetical protein
MKEGYDVRIFDPLINESKFINENPEFSKALCGRLEDVMAKSKVIVVTHKGLGRKAKGLIRGHIVLDLVRALDPQSIDGAYHGLSW